MKRLFAAVLVCALSGTMFVSYGQCDDPYDAVLCVRNINDQNPPTDIRNGVAESFWTGWTGDYIEMIPPGSCFPDRCGFTGADDATLTMKAAATDKGLYLLSNVRDNTWVDRASADDWGADALDFYFDGQSADEIWNCTTCRIGGYCVLCTYNTMQFQVWMGASAPSPGCRLAYYDEMQWSWQTLGLDWTMLESIHKIQVDIITVDGNNKAQEWFFPWEKVGLGALPVGTPLANVRIAFSGGYNDKDGDNVDPDCLRWIEKDPWDGTINQWGDFLLDANMGSVQEVNVAVRPQTANRGSLTASNMPSQLYTLRGEKIANGALNRVSTGAVMVQRTGANASMRMLGR
jgi:hypothetical protein